jgi:Ca2+-transporting ATPase
MWINLFQDTLAALALATDRPQPRVLDRKPEPRTAPLITMTMWKTIAGQSIYQLAVTFVLYFAGPRIFAYHTEHQIRQVETMVFNTYVWMQIFNMYKCVYSFQFWVKKIERHLTIPCSSRQYDNTFNIFEGVFSNWLFIAVSTTMIGAQILIIFVGGQAFSVVPLTGVQWAVSFVLGLLSLAVGALIRCTPDLALQRVVDKLKWRRAAAQTSSAA